MTYAEAGLELGGAARPWSHKTIQNLIRNGWLTSNGIKTRSARVLAASVEALSNRLQEKPSPCLTKPKPQEPPPPPPQRSAAKAASTSTRKARAAGTSKSPTLTVVSLYGDAQQGQLHGRKPTPRKRNQQEIEASKQAKVTLREPSPVKKPIRRVPRNKGISQ